MKILKIKQTLCVFIAIFSIFLAPTAKASTPRSWNDTGFSIDANGMTLQQVLNNFGMVYGVRVSMSVNGDVMLKSRMQSTNGVEFLDRLSLAHKFRWFVYNNVLYIVPHDDNTSMRLEVGEDSVQDAKAALTGIGLYDARFGWGEFPDEGVVLVSGPREYVELARSILLPNGEKKDKDKDKNSHEKGIMVFRLKFASATDRVITTRGQKETVPGIKTILSNLLNPQHQSSSTPKLTMASSDITRFDADSKKRSRGPKVSKGSAQEVGPGAAKDNQLAESDNADSDDTDTDRKGKSKDKSKEREAPPRIDADPSLNAVIVYDTLNKREMYKNLIAELDIEPQQVEIEALIVDIDRSKLAEMGVEWSVGIGNLTATMNSTGSDSNGTNTPIPGSTLLIRNASNFYARLKAMEGASEARILAKPTVLTLENVAAVLDLSQTAYVSLVGERVADVANITAGTMLKVLPRIVRDGGQTRIRLDVDIEDGALDKSDGSTSANRSTISTQAIVDTQQTLMIGGYHSESKTVGQSKTPVLGDMPLIGGLFRNSSDTRRDRERLFLITPRIAGSSGTAAPPISTPAARAKDVLAQESFAPSTSHILAPAEHTSNIPAQETVAANTDESNGRLRISGTLSCGVNCGK